MLFCRGSLTLYLVSEFLGAFGCAQLIITGDSHGCVHFVDARAQKLVAAIYLHKKGNKVGSVAT